MEKLIQSCKDYDDDIEELRGQISSNKAAIEKLQALIGDGTFVKSVAKNGNKLVITMSKGAPVEIELGEAAKGGNVVEVAANGEITIDGKGTGFFASKTKAPYVNAEGELITFDAEGNEIKTGIKANPVTAVKNADGSYTLTIKGEDGEKMEIKLPSPASVITGMIVSVAPTATPKTLGLEQFKFNLSSEERAAWKGTKAIPAEDSWFVASKLATTKGYDLDLQLTPVSVDAKEFEFSFINSKQKEAANVAFTVLDNTGIDAENGGSREPNSTRAGQSGKYFLAFKTVHFENKDAIDAFDEQFSTSGNTAYKYALCANHAFNAPDYRFVVSTIENGSLDFGNAYIKGMSDKSATAFTIDLNKEYPVEVEHSAHLYDMWLEVSPEQADLFGIVIDKEAHTIKATKSPDEITTAAFKLKIHTMNLNGTVDNTRYINVKLSNKIANQVVCEAVNHTIVADGGDAAKSKNYFSVSLDEMKKALGDKLSLWTNNVNFGQTEFQISDNPAVFSNPLALGVDPVIVKEVKDEKQKNVTAKSDANFIKFAITNATAASYGLDKQYYIRVTFKKSATEVLNTVVIPVTFKAPAFSTLFAPLAGYQDAEGVVNAYYYIDTENANDPVKDLPLKRFFDSKKIVADADVEVLDTEKIGEKDAANFFTITNDANFGNATIKLTKLATQDDFNKDGLNDAYATAVTLKVSAEGNKYENWAYTGENGVYKFQIRLMSPIERGTIETAEGQTITLKANELKKGALIKSTDIIGKDYTGDNTYSIVPDLVKGTSAAWSEIQLKKSKPVEIDVTESKYISGAEFVAATKDKDDNVVPGAIKLTATSISSDCTDSITIKVTDAWGLVKKQVITLNIVK